MSASDLARLSEPYADNDDIASLGPMPAPGIKLQG